MYSLGIPTTIVYLGILLLGIFLVKVLSNLFPKLLLDAIYIYN
jgi:hypothetical protein